MKVGDLMEKSKIISMLQNFYRVVESDNPTPEKKKLYDIINFS